MLCALFIDTAVAVSLPNVYYFLYVQVHRLLMSKGNNGIYFFREKKNRAGFLDLKYAVAIALVKSGETIT